MKNPRITTIRDHPLATPSGRVALSRLALYDKIGPGPHPCHWCGASLEWVVGHRATKNGGWTVGTRPPNALFVDHLDWNPQNDDPENLVPSCNACNAHRTRKGNRRMLTEDDLTVVWSGTRTRAVERFCVRCGERFLVPPSVVAAGRGRFCKRACRGSIEPTDRVVMVGNVPTRAVEVACEDCGEPFLKRAASKQRFCSQAGPGQCATGRATRLIEQARTALADPAPYS